MSFGAIVLLAVVQGLTEFLPVSSSGHLLAVRILFGVSDTKGTSFDAFLHLGTLMAVLVYYRMVWWGMARGVVRNDTEGRDKRELLAKLAIATVPGVVAGYIWQGQVGDVWRSANMLAWALIGTAIVLAVSDIFTKRLVRLPRATYWDALLIGLAQVVALVPGVSRSGMTIAAGRWRGLSRRQATNFSFLLSAPIIAGAGFSSLPGLLTTDAFSSGQLVVGFIVSFVSGWLAISIFLRVVERVSLLPFAVYLVLLAGVLLYV